MQRASHSLVETLRSIPAFSSLDEKTLLAIAGESINLFWKTGSSIFEPGSPGDALYVVVSGEVAIKDDGDNEIDRLGAGKFFGEMSLLLNATHSKRAIAVADSEILVLPKDSFDDLVSASSKLAEHFQKVLNSRRPRGTVGVSALRQP